MNKTLENEDIESIISGAARLKVALLERDDVIRDYGSLSRQIFAADTNVVKFHVDPQDGLVTPGTKADSRERLHLKVFNSDDDWLVVGLQYITGKYIFDGLSFHTIMLPDAYLNESTQLIGARSPQYLFQDSYLDDEKPHIPQGVENKIEALVERISHDDINISAGLEHEDLVSAIRICVGGDARTLGRGGTADLLEKQLRFAALRKERLLDTAQEYALRNSKNIDDEVTKSVNDVINQAKSADIFVYVKRRTRRTFWLELLSEKGQSAKKESTQTDAEAVAEIEVINILLDLQERRSKRALPRVVLVSLDRRLVSAVNGARVAGDTSLHAIHPLALVCNALDYSKANKNDEAGGSYAAALDRAVDALLLQYTNYDFSYHREDLVSRAMGNSESIVVHSHLTDVKINLTKHAIDVLRLWREYQSDLLSRAVLSSVKDKSVFQNKFLKRKQGATRSTSEKITQRTTALDFEISRSWQHLLLRFVTLGVDTLIYFRREYHRELRSRPLPMIRLEADQEATLFLDALSKKLSKDTVFPIGYSNYLESAEELLRTPEFLSTPDGYAVCLVYAYICLSEEKWQYAIDLARCATSITQIIQIRQIESVPDYDPPPSEEKLYTGREAYYLVACSIRFVDIGPRRNKKNLASLRLNRLLKNSERFLEEAESAHQMELAQLNGMQQELVRSKRVWALRFDMEKLSIRSDRVLSKYYFSFTPDIYLEALSLLEAICEFTVTHRLKEPLRGHARIVNDIIEKSFVIALELASICFKSEYSRKAGAVLCNCQVFEFRYNSLVTQLSLGQLDGVFSNYREQSYVLIYILFRSFYDKSGSVKYLSKRIRGDLAIAHLRYENNRYHSIAFDPLRYRELRTYFQDAISDPK